ncbi:hypothetical protein [Bacillus thuringiensis]|nr:hypothetical protein [Bacillus thuringiensis]
MHNYLKVMMDKEIKEIAQRLDMTEENVRKALLLYLKRDCKMDS